MTTIANNAAQAILTSGARTTEASLEAQQLQDRATQHTIRRSAETQIKYQLMNQDRFEFNKSDKFITSLFQG